MSTTQVQLGPEYLWLTEGIGHNTLTAPLLKWVYAPIALPYTELLHHWSHIVYRHHMNPTAQIENTTSAILLSLYRYWPCIDQGWDESIVLQAGSFNPVEAMLAMWPMVWKIWAGERGQMAAGMQQVAAQSMIIECTFVTQSRIPPREKPSSTKAWRERWRERGRERDDYPRRFGDTRQSHADVIHHKGPSVSTGSAP